MSALAEFKVQEVPLRDRVSGFIALVIQPDAGTIRKAYELAAALIPPGATQQLAVGSLPHVTLTQCVVRDAPRERLAQYVDRLGAKLRGVTIPLGAVTAFGGGFLFWHVDRDSEARGRLQAAHEDALGVAAGLLDPVANAAVVEGTAAAFGNAGALVENARVYGYALIKERYAPHITLGFDPRVGKEPLQHPHAMQVERVVVARLGALGEVERVLSL